MERTAEFDDIRPYYDEEVAPTIDRLLKDPEFQRVIRFIMPDIDWEQFETVMKTFTNKHDFQHTIIKETVLKLVGKTSTSINCAGFENITREDAYTYVSNHRDIVLDASLLCSLLSMNGYETTEIAIGDNLLIQPWIRDVVRLNKSFIVKRGVSVRQMLEVSMQLSRYIHYTITQKKQSIWIAQREGRAKNSDDRTQESLLKMLSMGGENKDFLENIRELNITPLSLSYEYDPCDYLKAKEFQQKRDNPEFKKSPQDDLRNMETGLFGFKGRIHFQIGKPINALLDSIDKNLNKNEQAFAVGELIDKDIYLNYQFYPVNYIAYDRLWGNDQFRSYYTSEDISAVDHYFQQKLDLIDLPDKDLPFLTEKLMEMYAYPVKNYLSVKK